jgi:hypothetical protein
MKLHVASGAKKPKRDRLVEALALFGRVEFTADGRSEMCRRGEDSALEEIGGRGKSKIPIG